MISCIPCRLKYKSDEGRRSVWITGMVYIPGYPTEVRRWAVMFTYVYMISPVYNCIYGNALSLLNILTLSTSSLNFEYRFPELWNLQVLNIEIISIWFHTQIKSEWFINHSQIKSEWFINEKFSEQIWMIYKWIWNQTVSEYSKMLKYLSISILSNYNDSKMNHCSSLYDSRMVR